MPCSNFLSTVNTATMQIAASIIPPTKKTLPSSMLKRSCTVRSCQAATTHTQARPAAIPASTPAVFLRIFNREKIKSLACRCRRYSSPCSLDSHYSPRIHHSCRCVLLTDGYTWDTCRRPPVCRHDRAGLPYSP